MYGAQTIAFLLFPNTEFENDVEMYGAQTEKIGSATTKAFENDVEMYGAQTYYGRYLSELRLRMMQKCMVLKREHR